MKSAIYIDEGRFQIVLTPECEFETGLIAALRDKKLSASIKHGTFHGCEGGWTRNYQEDSSLMVVVDKQEGPAT